VKFELDEAYVKRFSSGLFCVCLLFFRIAPARAQQEPPPAPGPGPQVQQPPPLPPQPPDVKMADEGKISIGPYGWFPTGQPFFDKGKATTSTVASRITLQGKSKLSPGVILSLPAGGHNALRVSFFETKAAGNITAPSDLILWNAGYSKGDYLATGYSLKSAKLSYEYLTWPFPVASRHFRLKTLWQAQFVKATSTFSAPLSADPTNIGTGSKTIILPTLGLGITEYFSPDFRVDINASGFGIPHHAAIADGEAALAYKVSRIELRGGFKGFYFKSSPKGDFYMRGRLVGGFVGIRLYLD
jgi:hypothetical protein